jgi:iron(III) transport system permease protein
VALVLIMPLLSIIVLSLFPTGDVWRHFIVSVLPHYFLQTILLLSGVGGLSLLIGVSLAWLISFYNFPLRNILQWLVLLPMAMPAYIVAFSFVDFFNYAGPLQSALRNAMGWTRSTDYIFPEIRSMAGAILVLSFALYPYIYLTARAAFLKQSMNQVDVARTLGKSSSQVLFDIILPQARPAIIVGLMLVLMECLNDIAAANFFGVQTLTLGVYSTWIGQNDLGSAAQLALVLLAMVSALIWIEKRAQGAKQKFQIAQRQRPISLSQRGWLISAWCAIPVLIGFILPAILLAVHAVKRFDILNSRDFLDAASNSILLASLATILTLSVGLFLAYANRVTQSRFIRALTIVSTFGYAVPGTVLAIGVMVAFGKFDNWLDYFVRSQFGFSSGLLLSGSLVAVLVSYISRFVTMGFGSFETGLTKITPNIDAVARVLGRSPWRVLFEIHFPLLRPAVFTAAILVFVDAMKELPATLLLRPFGFENLATQVFTFASLEKLEDSSVPALAIVLVGLVPVLILSRNLRDPAIKSP